MEKALTKYNVSELVKLGVKNYQVPHSSLLKRTGYGDLATPMVKDEGTSIFENCRCVLGTPWLHSDIM